MVVAGRKGDEIPSSFQFVLESVSKMAVAIQNHIDRRGRNWTSIASYRGCNQTGNLFRISPPFLLGLSPFVEGPTCACKCVELVVRGAGTLDMR